MNHPQTLYVSGLAAVFTIFSAPVSLAQPGSLSVEVENQEVNILDSSGKTSVMILEEYRWQEDPVALAIERLLANRTFTDVNGSIWKVSELVYEGEYPSISITKSSPNSPQNTTNMWLTLEGSDVYFVTLEGLAAEYAELVETDGDTLKFTMVSPHLPEGQFHKNVLESTTDGGVRWMVDTEFADLDMTFELVSP